MIILSAAFLWTNNGTPTDFKEHMIIARIRSGLGNQMFIYATGRALAQRTRAPLVLDTSFYKTYPQRQFLLNRFSIQARVLFPFERRLRWKLATFFSEPYVLFEEREERFYPELMVQKGNIELTGFFQCERYFESIASMLREDFTIDLPTDTECKELVHRILNSPSVSVHVRRTDYSMDAAETHGCLGIGYYEAARDFILHQMEEPQFFVFSDDPRWATEHIARLLGPRTQTISPRYSDIEQLQLMRACRHSILANSTFSWWGAWLGEPLQGVIIAPDPWLKMPGKGPREIIPSRWHRLASTWQP